MTDTDMAPPDGRITTERLDHVLAIGIDRPKKLNGFSPKMLVELAEAFTALERDEDAWVGVLFAHGAHFTAGLELDKVAPLMRERGSVFPVGSSRSPVAAAADPDQAARLRRAGHLLHARHRADAGGRHRGRRRRLPLRPDRGQARHHAGGRGHRCAWWSAPAGAMPSATC